MLKPCRATTQVAVVAVLASALLALPGLAQKGAPAEAAPPEGGEGDEAGEEGEGGEVDIATLNAMIESKLTFSTGDVVVGDGLATMKLAEGHRFLGAEEARHVIVNVWGNPPGAAEGTLGLILPKGEPVLSETGWAVVVGFQEEGYVEDDDAADINYDDLLEEMQEGSRQDNEQRKEQGFDQLQLVGWAEAPHYDSASKKLYWAKNLKVVPANPADAGGGNVLNYDVRILGRRGVLVLSAVSGMEELKAVSEGMKEVLAYTSFNEGHRYADFNPDMDKVAAYGIGALIAGKIASKAGLFAMLGVFLLKAKKLVIVAVIAVAALLKKVFGGSKESEG